MRRILILIALTGGIFAAPQLSRAQDSDELKKLKDKVQSLEMKLELLQKEIESLKKEKEAGRTSSGTTDKPIDKPAGKATAKNNGVEYVVEKVVRKDTSVMLEITGTSSKEDVSIAIHSVEAVDADGNTFKNGDLPAFGIQVKLREGIKTKFEVELRNVPAQTTEFKIVEITKGLVDMDPIKIKNIAIPK